MHEFCYIPKPAEFESPKSLLMRLAHYNGFGTVRRMCVYFELKPTRLVDLLDQNSPLLKILHEKDSVLAGILREAFYTIEKDSRNFAKLGDISLLRGACSNDFSYCPQCIEVSRSPIFNDLCKIGMCLLHDTELIAVCPSCKIKECWYNAQLFHCRCSFDRRTAKRIVASFISHTFDPFESPHEIVEIQFKYAIAKVCASLWDAHRDFGNHGNCDLPLQIIEHIESIVAAQVVRYPGFIKALHRAPWINYGSASIAWVASRALERLCTNLKSCPKDCCRLATIDRDNAKLAMFGDNESSTTDVRNSIIRNWAAQQSEVNYTVPPRCEIIRHVNEAFSSDAKQRVAERYGITEDEAAGLLKCPLSAVNNLIAQQRLINFETAFPYQLPPFRTIDRQYTENFARKFILLHELCDDFELPDYLLIDLIAATQIEIYGLSNPIFLPRDATSALFSQLKSHGFPTEIPMKNELIKIAPDALVRLEQALVKIYEFKQEHPESKKTSATMTSLHF